jgi:Zn-dependent peptidase ImmA (M78 family)
MTSQQRFKTMMHELGHALGINEMNTSGNSKISSNESNLNVMVQGIRATTQIGPCDRNVYRYLWK